MAEKTITAANSTYVLAVTGLFPVPIRLEGYSAEAAFMTDATENTETLMGVDGHMSAGFVPTMKRQTISLQADSPSNDLFEAWHEAMEAVREVYFANGIITLPAINRTYIMTRGVLSSYSPMPEAKKVLQPRSYVITWNNVNPVPVA